jgi:hypothetical protein
MAATGAADFDARGRTALGGFRSGLAAIGRGAGLEASAAGSALFVDATLGSVAVAVAATGSDSGPLGTTAAADGSEIGAG